ncbi:hypothetical protein MVI01_73510 [Myxococcus virescens]|uniref:Uncharacterized protein n=1 Tax=Myxococcus virescens TaxID=83456 RepID=A0A511HPP1_9BACT|nr:hypothetical protein MVI01_73510 [Myxococcus virescens]
MQPMTAQALAVGAGAAAAGGAASTGAGTGLVATVGPVLRPVRAGWACFGSRASRFARRFRAAVSEATGPVASLRIAVRSADSMDGTGEA